MKFETQRKLKNNIFYTKISRVSEDDQDCIIKEQQLEDDFGYVEIEAGGVFEAKITKDEHQDLVVTPVTSKAKAKEAEVNFKFSLPSKKVKLLLNVEIPFSCDATQEASREFLEKTLSGLKIAEHKCKIFEAVILDRIELAINAWKAKHTNFEEEILEAVHFPLDK